MPFFAYDQLKSAILSHSNLVSPFAERDVDTIVTWFCAQEALPTIPVAVSKSDFLRTISPCVFRIAALPTLAQQQPWRDFIAMAQSVDYINIQEFSSALSLAVSQGVLLQAEVDALLVMGLRVGSNAEAVFGAGAFVSSDDVVASFDV